MKRSPPLSLLSQARATPGALPQAEGSAKDRLLAAAHRCFEQYGVAKTTMEDVARAAALSRQTVYKHFASKSDLVTAFCVLESNRLNAEIQRRANRRRSLAARMAESVIAAVHFARENAYLRHLIEPHEIRARLTDRNDPVFALQRDRWAPMLEEGQRSGELSGDLQLDEVVTWLSLAQMALLVQFEQPDRDAELDHMVRRFVVAPLLAKA